MDGELITIGDELLSGRVVNSNGAHLAHHLGLAGFSCRWITAVGDREDDISTALACAKNRADFVITTGGLGPTEDDRTCSAVAKALDLPLRRDPLSWDVITNHLKKLNMSMNPGVAKMADLPEGAQRIDHVRPRAGFFLEQSGKPLFFLPGVPGEMKDMLRDFVLPTLQERFPQQVLPSRLLRIFGLRESEIGQLLAGLTEQYPTVSLGYLPSFPQHRLSVTVKADTMSAGDGVLDEVCAEVIQLLGIHVYGQGDDSLESVVGRLFVEKGHSLALAESCTGGLIADLITNFPGSSAFFDRAMVTYSDSAKIDHLRVPPEIISQYGSASAEVAEAMARGLREQHGVSMALAVTGVAGPAGSTATLPVGTAFLALFCHDAFRLERVQFRGSRREIKLAAAYTALDWLRRAMIDDSFFAADSPQ